MVEHEVHRLRMVSAERAVEKLKDAHSRALREFEEARRGFVRAQRTLGWVEQAVERAQATLSAIG